MEKSFNPTVFETLCCQDRIWSHYSGEFRTCKCGTVSVDETEYYCRYIGDIGKLKPLHKLDGTPLVPKAPTGAAPLAPVMQMKPDSGLKLKDEKLVHDTWVSDVRTLLQELVDNCVRCDVNEQCDDAEWRDIYIEAKRLLKG